MIDQDKHIFQLSVMMVNFVIQLVILHIWIQDDLVSVRDMKNPRTFVFWGMVVYMLWIMLHYCVIYAILHQAMWGSG